MKDATAAALRSKFENNGAAFGAFATLPCALSVELLCNERVDYVCIDQQHGLIDYSSFLAMLRGIEGRNSVPFTRVPANQPWMIGQALDAGAQGVIVPMVNCAAEAVAAVAACRYSPRGSRSFGPVRSAITLGTRDLKVLGDDVFCFVMIETKEAVENVEEIAATPGLDGLYVGPADLALTMGLAPELEHSDCDHSAALDRVLAACQKHSLIPGIQCATSAGAMRMSQRGFRMLTFTKDSSLLLGALQREVAEISSR